MNNIKEITFNLKDNRLISLLFALFLATSININHGMGGAAIFMLIISLAGLFITRKMDYQPLQRWEWAWIASLLLFVGFIYLGVLRGFDTLSSIDSQSRLILAIPVYLYVRRVGVNLTIVLIGAALGAILAGIFSGYQYIELGIPRTLSIISDIAVLLFVFCLYGAIWHKKYWIKLLMITATIFGLYAIALSGGRGGWAALPVIIIVLLIYNVFNMTFWTRLAIPVLTIFVAIVIYLSPNLPVKNRVDVTIDNVAAYLTEGEMSSIGIRLEMWKASWLIAKKDNFLGNGIDDLQSDLTKIINEGKVSGYVAGFGPHNQYFTTLIDEGIFGLISLLALFFIPLYVTLKNLHNESKSHLSAIFVVTILLSYMVFMLSVSSLVIQIRSLFFAFSLVVFLGFFVFSTQNKPVIRRV